MVRVRLARGGARKKPYYHIVVIDKRDKRDGKCLERIGSYDPLLESENRIKLNMERLEYWVSKGAQLSNRVKLLKNYTLDPKNIDNRTDAKAKELEKTKARKARKAKEEAKAEQPAKEEAKAEEPAKEEAKAEQPAKEEAKAEEPAKTKK
ncbi:MAG: 30S ribosomal protein S16 [Gammaproteobacteria bacterium]|nr:30S ribosomal protein S16 [Gammaproteobacteria bacterium]